MKLEKIGETAFKSRLVLERSWGEQDIGEHDCEMILWAQDGYHFIEWVVDDIAEAEIGLTINGKKIIEYDGVMSLPHQAVSLLNELGYDTSEVYEG